MCGLLQKRWKNILDRERRKIRSWGGGVDPLEIFNLGAGVDPGDERMLEYVRDDDVPRLVRGRCPELPEWLEKCGIEADSQLLLELPDRGLCRALGVLGLAPGKHQHCGASLAHIEHISAGIAHDDSADLNDLHDTQPSGVDKFVRASVSMRENSGTGAHETVGAERAGSSPVNVQGKVFVVTGAGNGIGREVTLQLLAKGARVAGIDLNEQGLAETSKLANAGTHFTTHVVNITDRDATAALPATVLEAHGQVDGLINIAGVIQQFVRLIDLPFSEMEKVMNVNFWGVINMVKAFLPTLIERPEASLVNISSMGAYAPVPGQAVYGASKAAVRLLSEALYAELMETNVAVSVVFPGAIGTNIAQNSGVSIGSGAESTHKTTAPSEAGRVIVEEAIEKGRFRATIGRDAAIMDKLARLNPKKAAEIIAKQMGDLLG